MSHVQMSRSFRSVIVKSNQTLSLDTTIKDVILEGALYFWLSPTNLAFFGKIYIHFIPKIICKSTYFYPGLISPFLISSGVAPLIFKKDTMTFFIYGSIASFQNTVPVSTSISRDSSTVLGIFIPKLWVVRQYFEFTALCSMMDLGKWWCGVRVVLF